MTVTLPDLKAAVGQFFFPSETQQSQLHFTSILAEPADNAETIRHVLDILHEKHGIGKHISHLVVAGDAKTYEYLLEAKRVYGEDLNWLLPYLGKWHLLKNIQAPLMKIYLDAGLRQLLSVLHKGATHVAVASASGFRKTHIFLMQSWEAMYREQMAMFCSQNVNSNGDANLTWKNLYSCVVEKIRSEGSNIFTNLSSERNALSPLYLHSCSHYVTLFLAMRLRQFDLRNISVRNLTPIFHAMDRPTYLKLVPFHMAAMKQYPPDILEYFQKGAFSVSVTGRNGCCFAFDEAHEMLINKEVKMSMTTTGIGSLSRLVHYLPYRAQLMKTFKSEVTMSKDRMDENDSDSSFKLTEDNVKLYIDKLKNESNFFRAITTPDSVCHIFTGEVATTAVSNDLKIFYEKGEEDLNAFISCVVLNTSGQKPPKR
ncbi:hypothetical protein BSL78_15588 [Apostichopus japonicus]|uniref:DUF6589 domain-containing protein n=1 Tax=Stichopus japonicus TaxID=307972 RepID=A0A2G8KHR6_STIJA|nr:hypothetical protein BSL78_15588 [Apostichopus japonicus]